MTKISLQQFKDKLNICSKKWKMLKTSRKVVFITIILLFIFLSISCTLLIYELKDVKSELKHVRYELEQAEYNLERTRLSLFDALDELDECRGVNRQLNDQIDNINWEISNFRTDLWMHGIY